MTTTDGGAGGAGELPMQVDALKVGLAAAIVFAISWLVCSAFVIALPGGMMNIGGYMIHADFSDLSFNITVGGFFAGLVVWSVAGGLVAWAIAAVYNRLIA